MSTSTITDPDPSRPGLPARLRSAATSGRRLLQGGSQVLWTEPPGAGSRPVGSRVRWRSLGIGALVVAAATALSLLRQPGVGALDTVWAEDGEIFLSDAASKSWLDSILTPYAGYFHLGPRVLAELATVVPPAAAAATLAILAALCTALLAVLVYAASGGHLRTRVARTLVAAVVVVAPLATDEVPNSIANLQWPGLYALFWMLLWTPRGRSGRVIAAAVTFAVATSSILAVVFLPLAVARVMAPAGVRRDRHRMVRSSLASFALRMRSQAGLVAGLLAAGVALQAIGVLSGVSDRGVAPDPVLAVSGFVIRAVPATLIGQRWLPDHVNASWLVLAVLAWLIVAAVVVSGLRRRDSRPNWVLAGVAFVHAAAIYALPVLLSGFATPRYALPAAMLLVTAIVAVLEPDAPGVGAGTLWIFAAVLAIVCAVNLRVDNPRAHGPSWSDGLRTAQRECVEQASETVRITIAPLSDRGWYSTLPCRYVRR